MIRYNSRPPGVDMPAHFYRVMEPRKSIDSGQALSEGSQVIKMKGKKKHQIEQQLSRTETAKITCRNYY